MFGKLPHISLVVWPTPQTKHVSKYVFNLFKDTLNIHLVTFDHLIEYANEIQILILMCYICVDILKIHNVLDFHIHHAIQFFM